MKLYYVPGMIDKIVIVYLLFQKVFKAYYSCTILNQCVEGY